MFVDLMSPTFARFIKNVHVVAPKPTTFEVQLTNDMTFHIVYNGKASFTAKINGKKYEVTEINASLRASKAIASPFPIPTHSPTVLAAVSPAFFNPSNTGLYSAFNKAPDL